VEHEKQRVIFGVYAENLDQLNRAIILADSIRTFGCSMRSAPFWIFLPDNLDIKATSIRKRIMEFDIEFKTVSMPDAARKYYYATKVLAAGKAEKLALGNCDMLVWMDDDTVFLKEPLYFYLAPQIKLAYRPVMHNVIGSDISKPPDPFWSRIYQKLNIPESAMFPMITPADKKTIRPYFNAGLLVLRPSAGIFQKWAEYWSVLNKDSEFEKIANKNNLVRIFLHQTALVGAILNHVKKSEMTELSAKYNYPFFFKRMFGADEEFDDLTEVVSFRYEFFFRDPAPEWEKKVKCSPDRLSWIKSRFAK